jgi:hypothetical protein
MIPSTPRRLAKRRHRRRAANPVRCSAEFGSCSITAKAILLRTAEPQPQERRRKGETDKGAIAPFRTMLRRLAKTGAAVARGRYAALQPAQQAGASASIAPEPITSADAYAAATASTATTFEWLMNMWDANSGMEVNGALDDSLHTQQNHYYPQP